MYFTAHFTQTPKLSVDPIFSLWETVFPASNIFLLDTTVQYTAHCTVHGFLFCTLFVPLYCKLNCKLYCKLCSNKRKKWRAYSFWKTTLPASSLIYSTLYCTLYYSLLYITIYFAMYITLYCILYYKQNTFYSVLLPYFTLNSIQTLK